MKSKHLNLMITVLFLSLTHALFAASSIEFYASNNTQVINLQQAYQRMAGVDQQHLQNKMIYLMQKNQIEQDHFEEILGMYSLSTQQAITADNTEVFSTSPYQKISEAKIFSVAKQLAISLNQETVAVFMPSEKKSIGEIKIFFSGARSIHETLNLIKKKLPPTYSKAFSLHLAHACQAFSCLKVSSIEWLGSQLNVDTVKQAFPQEQVISKSGQVFLIYQNGKKQKL